MRVQHSTITGAGLCYWLRYGNIITTSRLSAEECKRNHARKLLKLGYSPESVRKHLKSV